MDKRTTEQEVIAELRDGMTIGIGGWGSRRKPMSLVREIIRSDLNLLLFLAGRQYKVMRYILDCYREGWLPTYREIGHAMDIGSANGVSCHVNALKTKGWLATKENHAGIVLGHRALTVVQASQGTAFVFD